MNTLEQDEAVEKIAGFMKGAHTCMFTTKAGQELVSRPMTLQKTEFDGDVWFFASKESDKINEIKIDPEVNISFASGSAWVSLSGKAHIINDSEKIEELWNPLLKDWFPEGSDDPHIVLIKVVAESTEYWDTDNKLVNLLSMAKAAITGKKAQGGENETVGLT